MLEQFTEASYSAGRCINRYMFYCQCFDLTNGFRVLIGWYGCQVCVSRLTTQNTTNSRLFAYCGVSRFVLRCNCLEAAGILYYSSLMSILVGQTVLYFCTKVKKRFDQQAFEVEQHQRNIGIINSNLIGSANELFHLCYAVVRRQMITLACQSNVASRQNNQVDCSNSSQAVYHKTIGIQKKNKSALPVCRKAKGNFFK